MTETFDNSLFPALFQPNTFLNVSCSLRATVAYAELSRMIKILLGAFLYRQRFFFFFFLLLYLPSFPRSFFFHSRACELINAKRIRELHRLSLIEGTHMLVYRGSGIFMKGLCRVIFAKRCANIILPTSGERVLIKRPGEVLNIFKHTQSLFDFHCPVFDDIM